MDSGVNSVRRINIILWILIVYLFNYCKLISSNEISGEIFGFIDANYDRYTDLLVRQNKNHLTVYIASKEDATFSENANYKVSIKQFQDETIINVGVADFNGDSLPDLLITSRIEKEKQRSKDVNNNGFNVSICFGTGKSFQNCSRNEQWINFLEQPTILNCDHDNHFSDFFVVTSNGSRVCYLGRESEKVEDFHEVSAFETKTAQPAPLFPNVAHGFVDVSGDLNSDMVLLTKTTSGLLPSFEVWQASEGEERWKLAVGMVPVPTQKNSPTLFSSTDAIRIGHVVFDDFNRDGRVDILLPYCLGACQNLSLMFCTFKPDSSNCTWSSMDVPLVTDKIQYSPSFRDDPSFPFIVRSGDYTQNGFPDLIIVLDAKDKASGGNPISKKAYFVENVPCYIKGLKCEMGREFRASLQPVGPCQSVNEAAYFDLNEDGTLDILYECRDETDSAGNGKIEFVASLYIGDTTFLKVEAYTATCSTVCPNSKEGSGISLPGASLSYVMIDTEGNDISSAYTQQTSTTYRSLLLPYALFGLGRSPNFVDKLRLGIPSAKAVSQTWVQIVPNSRMYVIPYEPDKPNQWVGRLYVTPSRLILLSVAALGGACVLIIITVIILHWYEVRVDRKERELQRKHFHFDAM